MYPVYGGLRTTSHNESNMLSCYLAKLLENRALNGVTYEPSKSVICHQMIYIMRRICYAISCHLLM